MRANKNLFWILFVFFVLADAAYTIWALISDGKVEWVGTVAIFVFGMIQAVVYGWVLGIGPGERAMHEGAHIRVPRVVQYVLKYVAPLYLGAIFVTFCWKSVPGYLASLRDNPQAGYAIGLIAAVFAGLLVLVHLAGRRWAAVRVVPWFLRARGRERHPDGGTLAGVLIDGCRRHLDGGRRHLEIGRGHVPVRRDHLVEGDRRRDT